MRSGSSFKIIIVINDIKYGGEKDFTPPDNFFWGNSQQKWVFKRYKIWIKCEKRQKRKKNVTKGEKSGRKILFFENV